MELEKTLKLKKRARKLSNILSEFAPQDIEALRKNDLEFDVHMRTITDIAGTSNPYWRVHPLFSSIRCSINGEIDIADRIFEVREYGGQLRVCFSNCKKRYSAADLVLSCFNPCPGNRKEYKICYKDGNFRNIKPCNLYWERLYVK